MSSRQPTRARAAAPSAVAGTIAALIAEHAAPTRKKAPTTFTSLDSHCGHLARPLPEETGIRMTLQSSGCPRSNASPSKTGRVLLRAEREQEDPSVSGRDGDDNRSVRPLVLLKRRREELRQIQLSLALVAAAIWAAQHHRSSEITWHRIADLGADPQAVGTGVGQVQRSQEAAALTVPSRTADLNGIVHAVPEGAEDYLTARSGDASGATPRAGHG